MPNHVVLNNFIGGQDSSVPPWQLNKDQYAHAYNITNRGGIVQTRPGFKLCAGIEGEVLQGMVTFKPRLGLPRMLVAVDGLIYKSIWPFQTFEVVEGLDFVATAPIINFAVCIKSVKRKSDGSLSLIEPRMVVIIQDGLTQAGEFDSTTDTGFHTKPGTPTFGVPIGLWMAWTGSRLWVGKNTRVYASDLACPDTFSEETYLAERSSFEMPGEVTGMMDTADGRGLLVFTEDTTTAIQSSIIQRTLWQETPNFQKTVLPDCGCVAGKTAINQYGKSHWLSKRGMVNIDAAFFSSRSSEVPTIDFPMLRSKERLNYVTDGACASFIENFLLVSVPHASIHNEHTWVMDQTPVAPGNPQGQCWASVWTGIRPVAYGKISFNGRDELYCAAFDKTSRDGTRIHIWKMMTQDRKDNGGRITCQWESAMFSSGDQMRFTYAELEITELAGPVELKVFVGGQFGPWIEILDKHLTADEGPFGSPLMPTIGATTVFKSFKPQSRSVKTEQFDPSKVQGCLPETPSLAGRDKAFQLLVEWRGRMGIRQIKICTEPDPGAQRGECTPDESGTKAIDEQGEEVSEIL